MTNLTGTASALQGDTQTNDEGRKMKEVESRLVPPISYEYDSLKVGYADGGHHAKTDYTGNLAEGQR
jgi:hypothetical protein